MTYTHLVKSGLSSCANQLDGERPTRTQRSNGHQHAGAHPNRLQFIPQNMMRDRGIGPLEVPEAGLQRALEDASCVNEGAHGKEVMEW